MTVSVKAPTSTTGSIQLNGSDVLTIDSSGNLTAPNNLTITGTTTNTGAITSTGGIYLGGTAAANLLDDYETGTWTPTTNGDDTGELTNPTGVYVKVGQMVTVMFQFNVASSFTNYYIGGLPFLVKNYGNYGTTGYFKYYSNRYWRLAKNSTLLYSTSDGETAAAIGACRCTITYRSQI